MHRHIVRWVVIGVVIILALLVFIGWRSNHQYFVFNWSDMDRFNSMAIQNKDITICEKLVNIGLTMSNIEYNCYLSYAEARPYDNVCLRKNTNVVLSMCIEKEMSGSGNNDVSFCSALTGDSQVWCVLGVAIQKKDKSICNSYLKDSDVRLNKCLELYDKNIQNPQVPTSLKLQI